MPQYWIFDVGGEKDVWEKLGWFMAEDVEDAREKAKQMDGISDYGEYFIINQKNMNSLQYP